jgi:hypothetical protein
MICMWYTQTYLPVKEGSEATVRIEKQARLVPGLAIKLIAILLPVELTGEVNTELSFRQSLLKPLAPLKTSTILIPFRHFPYFRSENASETRAFFKF